MSTRNITTKTSTISPDKLVGQWANVAVIGSILLILLLTLFPFDFAFKDASRISYRSLVTKALGYDGPIEALGNVLLFIPLGFGLTCLLQKRKLEGTAVLVVMQALSSGLSLTIEALQVFLPARSPTLLDLLTNSVGAFLGFLCCRLWGIKILTSASALIQKTKGYLSLKKLTLGFIGYATLTFLISIHFASPGNLWNLSNWDPTFPLLLGNERTGKRPWHGYISEIYIANRGISEAEVAQAFSEKGLFAAIKDSLVASYQLTGRGSYPDRTGHLTNLSWKGEPPDIQDGMGVFLSPSHWLETDNPVAVMTQKLRQTSQFTLSAIVATADKMQIGPARIISVSKDSLSRNLTIGQNGTDLVLRLRTPFTGVNAAKPELIVANVFADTNYHHIIVSFSDSLIQIYVDKLQNYYSLKLNPEAAFFWYLSLRGGRVYLNTYNTNSYKFMYYVLIFIPLGFFLALIATILTGKFVFYILLICGGVLLPSLILEAIWVSVSRTVVKPENLILSMVLTVGTMLLFKRQAASWFKSNISE